MENRQIKSEKNNKLKESCSSGIEGEKKPEFLTPDKKQFLDIKEHLAYFEKESAEWYKKYRDTDF